LLGLLVLWGLSLSLGGLGGLGCCVGCLFEDREVVCREVRKRIVRVKVLGHNDQGLLCGAFVMDVESSS
jgi:hypothetical protein